MIFDDIGSFPLPAGIRREWAEKNYGTKEYAEMVKRAYLMKLKAGVELPNYPQFRDMNQMFLNPIKNEEFQEEPYLIRKKHALIPEVSALMDMEVEALRVCITGPFEIYYREFGGIIYNDLLDKIAMSIERFVENLNPDVVRCISFDEPSLGTNPELQPTHDQLETAYGKMKFSGDVQIHLHSPLFYTEILDLRSINVIGIESARDERAMDFVDPEDLESHDKFLRIGIARSDIDGIVAEYNSRYRVNVWGDPDKIGLAIDEIENPETIEKRLRRALDLFGERLKYIGPDCGLFSFPSQENAVKLLENVREAKERI